MADFLYGDGAPPWSRAVLQAWFDTWCCVCLAFSLLVRSRSSSEKGGTPPFPPLLAPTLGWPPRDGLLSAPQLPTPGWPLEEQREKYSTTPALNNFYIRLNPLLILLQPNQNAKNWIIEDLGTDEKKYFENFPPVLIQNSWERTLDSVVLRTQTLTRVGTGSTSSLLTFGCF